MYRITLKFLMVGFCILSFSSIGWACDRSGLTLDSLTFDANTGNYTIYTQLTIGGGVLGPDAGANAFTSAFAIGTFGGTGTIVGFNPTLIVSDTLQTTFLGVLLFPPTISAGISGLPDSATGYLLFQPVNVNDVYACVTNTSDCGLPHTDMKKIAIVMNDLPDSIVAIGLEGQGNPVLGCHGISSPGYDADNTIRFNVLPVVWGPFTGEAESFGNRLHWETRQESNNNYFRVLRKDDDHWTELTRTNSAGNSSEVSRYDYTDYAPHSGTNLYRIEQVDLNGQSSRSKVLVLEYAAPSRMTWGNVAPVPTESSVTARFFSPIEQHATWQLLNMQGQSVRSGSVSCTDGPNTLSVDLSDWDSGVYILEMRGEDEVIYCKVVRR